MEEALLGSLVRVRDQIVDARVPFRRPVEICLLGTRLKRMLNYQSATSTGNVNWQCHLAQHSPRVPYLKLWLADDGPQFQVEAGRVEGHHAQRQVA